MIFYSDLLCGSSRHEKISCDHSRLQADTKKIKKKKANKNLLIMMASSMIAINDDNTTAVKRKGS
jgi:hypothetical protein